MFLLVNAFDKQKLAKLKALIDSHFGGKVVYKEIESDIVEQIEDLEYAKAGLNKQTKKVLIQCFK